MAGVITFLVALPFFWLIGNFYFRLGVWLCRVLRSTMRAAAASHREASS